MKVLFGVLMIICGIVLGLFVGLWLMLVGGIIQLVNAVTTDPISSIDVGWGVMRIIFASFAGWLSAVVLIVPGFGLVSSGSSRHRRRVRR